VIKRYWYEQVEVRKRHGVPHWQVRGGIYFLTWRLAGSIPREEEIQLSNLQNEVSRLREMDAALHSLDAAEREYFRLLERSLDRGTGNAHIPGVA